MDTYEEKYNEALERAKTLYENAHGMILKKWVEQVFPELAESEDERIRKSLIDMLKNDEKCYLKEIAWLEKQGEPKEINPSEFDSQLNRLLGQFKPLPKEELASSLSFYLNVVQNDGTYKEEKQGEQKPTWSEEDDFMYNKIKNLLTDISLAPESRNSLFDWLKCLKDRVQPQQKQEWSEEDKRKIDRIYSILMQAADTHAFSTSCRLIGDKECIELQDFLKSLRPHSQWKPSDEQLDALHDAAVYVYKSMSPYPKGILMKLYKQLKKLREE